MKINRIIAKPTRGIYKDKQIEVEFGINSENTFVKVDGKILEGIQFVGVKCRVGEFTKLVIEKIKI
jgi:hypothetical protein